MSKILLPIDGSDCSQKTIQWATRLFNRDDAEFLLIYVLPILTEVPIPESLFAEATAFLEESRTTLEQQGCRVIESEYLLGLTVEQICHYAETKDVDLVVLGSHGRSGFSKLLMGSVGEGVLEHCHRPVVIYRNVERAPAKVAHHHEGHFSSKLL